ncbi:trypsin-like peptidase domain-containing protein [Nonomuraea sp. SBT364]|uniref:trypsin-like peptidase domain-containing protein n=1 Tax=Nonomuraea sp. SBT364 TaxID=1580530 RepID=UPI00069EC354|nr:trypsin-like peptidase domain-containing protein [Nonomuraea sp. SBT364]
MTDETRPDDGRKPSDNPDPQGRPEFLPAGDQPERRPEPSWGAPSGEPGDTTIYGTPPHSFGSPEGGRGDTRAYETPSFGAPYGMSNPAGEGPSYAPPGADGPSYNPPGAESPSYGFSSPGGEGPSYAPPGAEGPSYGFGNPGGEGSPYGFGNPSGEGSAYGFGNPGGEGPAFGHRGTPPPPPRALGMGPGWAPPPPGGMFGGTMALPRRGPSTSFLVVLAIVIALVASLLGSLGTYLLTRPGGGTDPSFNLGAAPTGSTNRPPESVAGVASRVLPSVVSLEVGNVGNTEGASGSGFLIKDGYVVTNNHVVALAAKGGEIKIQFNNRKTTSARIVGRDPGSDLAVVKPDETFGTPEIRLGNSDEVVVGDPVIAIGSPLGLTGTVTTGIVSSLNRPVIAGDESGGAGEEPAYISAIQTDAAINPGNSGGPLVNGRGEVVGVNSAIATLSRSVTNQSGSIGLGFAIPVNQARRVAQELVTTGKAKRPKIGIVLDPEWRGEGVRIATGNRSGRPPVDAGGPAEKAGLKAGDVILEVDGLRLQDGNELIALIRSKSPGSKIEIKYERDDKEHTATLVVSADEEPVPTPS